VTSIAVLPDDILLAMFDFYVEAWMETWQLLAHVCRRWRSLVFGSPRRLSLRLFCSPKTPARDTLDVWPPLPLYIWCRIGYPMERVDNIIAVLERSDRVVEIHIQPVSSSQLESFSAAMQEPFPELKRLEFRLEDKSRETVSVLPDSFLGGFAPRLRFLSFKCIPFPGLPKLILSATHLVELHLRDIPHSGYIPPDAMVTALSTLTSLKTLTLNFQSPRSCPDRAGRRLLPLTRLVLPVLESFWFKGVNEYWDDLMARIDAPLLDILEITFFNQILFDTPQFMQFISRTPRLKAVEKAHLSFFGRGARANFSTQTSHRPWLSVVILCEELGWQISSLEQVCTSCFPPLSVLEDLYISQQLEPDRQDNIEETLWLELLQPFTALKNLYLSKEFAPHIALALQELVRGRTIEVLPTLQNIFLEDLQLSGPVQEGIQQFAATREVMNLPVAVLLWDFSAWDKF
jgi:hypothetical protein